ncbi:MAG: hypothetical protein MZV64_50200 [Ignavibacteriales bacterium]|nr:hypothetical protein [Ignavibacteriales bacterium]
MRHAREVSQVRFPDHRSPGGLSSRRGSPARGGRGRRRGRSPCPAESRLPLRQRRLRHPGLAVRDRRSTDRLEAQPQALRRLQPHARRRRERGQRLLFRARRGLCRRRVR